MVLGNKSNLLLFCGFHCCWSWSSCCCLPPPPLFPRVGAKLKCIIKGAIGTVEWMVGHRMLWENIKRNKMYYPMSGWDDMFKLTSLSSTITFIHKQWGGLLSSYWLSGRKYKDVLGRWEMKTQVLLNIF